MLDIIRIRGKQIYALLLLLSSFFLESVILRKRDSIWIVSEKGTEARDNGYWMFRYIKTAHPEIDCRYLITENATDRDKLKNYEECLVVPNTFYHYRLIWRTICFLDGQPNGGLPDEIGSSLRFSRMVRRMHPSMKTIFLQHGIISSSIPYLFYPNFVTDIFVCGAYPEYQFVKNNFGHKPDIVQYTGLARYDNLGEFRTNKKQILLMPTWRIWLNKKDFLQSKYYKAYRHLLENPKLHNLLQNNDLQLIFYPHYKIHQLGLLKHFKELDFSPNIIIADKENYNVQDLLKESALLITDYSSIFYDFAYMKKPLVYYMFDETDYRQGHQAPGFYNYHDGLGDWADNEDGLIDTLHRLVSNGMQMNELYKSRVDDFFLFRDNKNCERIYKAIINL